MAAMIRPDYPLVADALTVWTGWGVSPMPKRSDERLIAHFGQQLAQELLPILKSLQDDYYPDAGDNLSEDLIEMEKVASERFRREHPDIPEKIVKIFAWCYTYDYR
jgi:hypothetical protein